MPFSTLVSLIYSISAKHGIGTDLSFSCYIYATEELCHKGTLYKSCAEKHWQIFMPENFKLLTLPVLEIWSLMCSQNGHL